MEARPTVGRGTHTRGASEWFHSRRLRRGTVGYPRGFTTGATGRSQHHTTHALAGSGAPRRVQGWAGVHLCGVAEQFRREEAMQIVLTPDVPLHPLDEAEGIIDHQC